MAAADDETPPGLEEPDVVTKYKMAGEMASRVLKAVRAACVDGARTIDICKLGDELILKETGAVYNKKNEDGEVVQKGIGFPTCISVNNCICHNCPIESDKEIKLATGDLVKIDLGVHIDGYIAPVASTMVVGGGEVTGRKADVMMAAYTAAEVALRMIRPGCKTYDVTDAIQKVMTAFNCKGVEGFLSHQLTRNTIDGEKAVILNPNEQLRKEHKNSEIEANEVYALDIVASTGEGKTKESEQRTTVFKKKPDLVYQLKMKTSRQFLTEINKKFSVMPFTIRACADEKTARLGVVECIKHDVVEPYKILLEKEGEFVAQVKILVMVMPNGNLRGTTDADFNLDEIKTEFKLEDEELLTLLKTQVGSKNKKKKKKKKAADKTAEAEGADAAAAKE